MSLPRVCLPLSIRLRLRGCRYRSGPAGGGWTPILAAKSGMECVLRRRLFSCSEQVREDPGADIQLDFGASRERIFVHLALSRFSKSRTAALNGGNEQLTPVRVYGGD